VRIVEELVEIWPNEVCDTVLREKVLRVKDVEKNSGQDIQLKVAQKLYPVSYILHKTSSLGSN